MVVTLSTRASTRILIEASFVDPLFAFLSVDVVAVVFDVVVGTLLASVDDDDVGEVTAVVSAVAEFEVLLLVSAAAGEGEVPGRLISKSGEV